MELDDSAFPQVTYRCGASGVPVPVLRGTGLRIQTIVVAAEHWGMEPREIAQEYGVSEEQVHAGLAFYAAHRHKIDLAITVEGILEVEGEQG